MLFLVFAVEKYAGTYTNCEYFYKEINRQTLPEPFDQPDMGRYLPDVLESHVSRTTMKGKKVVIISTQEGKMKKLVSVLIAIQIMFMMSLSYAASGKCTVKKIEGDNIVIDCGKKAADFKVKDKIKIKSMRKSAIEGC